MIDRAKDTPEKKRQEKRDGSGRYLPGTAPGPGRPKGSISPTEALRRRLRQAARLAKRDVPRDQRPPTVNEIIDGLLEAALLADRTALTILFDRTDGKVPDRLQFDDITQTHNPTEEFYRWREQLPPATPEPSGTPNNGGNGSNGSAG